MVQCGLECVGIGGGVCCFVLCGHSMSDLGRCEVNGRVSSSLFTGIAI